MLILSPHSENDGFCPGPQHIILRDFLLAINCKDAALKEMVMVIGDTYMSKRDLNAVANLNRFQDDAGCHAPPPVTGCETELIGLPGMDPCNPTFAKICSWNQRSLLCDARFR